MTSAVTPTSTTLVPGKSRLYRQQPQHSHHPHYRHHLYHTHRAYHQSLEKEPRPSSSLSTPTSSIFTIMKSGTTSSLPGIMSRALSLQSCSLTTPLLARDSSFVEEEPEPSTPAPIAHPESLDIDLPTDGEGEEDEEELGEEEGDVEGDNDTEGEGGSQPPPESATTESTTIDCGGEESDAAAGGSENSVDRVRGQVPLASTAETELVESHDASNSAKSNRPDIVHS